MAYTRKRPLPTRSRGEKWLPEFRTDDCTGVLYIRVPDWMPLRLREVAEMLSTNGPRVTPTDLVRQMVMEFLKENKPKNAA